MSPKSKYSTYPEKQSFDSQTPLFSLAQRQGTVGARALGRHDAHTWWKMMISMETMEIHERLAIEKNSDKKWSFI